MPSPTIVLVHGGRCFLSTTTRFAATDEVSRARLLVVAVKAYAEDRVELAA